MKAAEDGGEPSGYWSYSIYRTERENKVLKQEIQKLKSTKKMFRISEKETLTEEQLIEKLKWNREKKAELEHILKDNKTVQMANNQNEALNEANRQLSEIRKSFSFRIGLAITWLPRKIRSVLHYR